MGESLHQLACDRWIGYSILFVGSTFQDRALREVRAFGESLTVGILVYVYSHTINK